MTSKLLDKNQALLNKLDKDSHPQDKDSFMGKTMTSIGKPADKEKPEALNFTQNSKFSL